MEKHAARFTLRALFAGVTIACIAVWFAIRYPVPSVLVVGLALALLIVMVTVCGFFYVFYAIAVVAARPASKKRE